jgi:hypothetical protein
MSDRVSFRLLSRFYLSQVGLMGVGSAGGAHDSLGSVVSSTTYKGFEYKEELLGKHN